ncbi:FliI/YscN family ATPase [Stenotrophomonas aracearum]|jgi:flagellum-specific ATP synthase|uniref:protein-secreting ATPase n=1 Tax=Stenotrophomonas aracearum TaxID=3003272 RepID=A0ABY9YCI8_9GAMM|nr:FliI/YscN family ATPase [Stenotrophomonas sp. A5588]WNH48589.1 FliI/YscN family ATPase [Stenotrophomonas sp. A5588]
MNSAGIDTLLEHLRVAPMVRRLGRVESFNGLVVEALGPDVVLGERCLIEGNGGHQLDAMVVGFRAGMTQLMPYGELTGIAPGHLVRPLGRGVDVGVGEALLGRVINAHGTPLDDGPALELEQRYPLARPPINPLHRLPIERVMETGVRAIDTLLTLGEGQRVGIMAGSGVGKSTLLGALARQVDADVTVLALIGERGREVNDFLQHSLGSEGLKRSVVVVATADEPALMRTQAAYAAHAVAEYFRDQGKAVLLVVDSMTRFAMAQRDIGLSIGEPPTFRGYTPSVFAQLPRMLERCGRVRGGGSITGIYSVLVEGDDMNEPVTDHMRAILDGHIVLDRELAARGHHPAIDVLHSASRLIGAVASGTEQDTARRARRELALYEGARDLVELGAHQPGVNLELDGVLLRRPAMEAFLQQVADKRYGRKDALQQLRSLLAEGAAA